MKPHAISVTIMTFVWLQTAGAFIFAFLLSENEPLTCIKLSCVISLCALPLLIFLVGEMNQLADSIFDHSEPSCTYYN
ncbi:hypothetical protein ABZP36_024876 [Zizania latifolia]